MLCTRLTLGTNPYSMFSFMLLFFGWVWWGREGLFWVFLFYFLQMSFFKLDDIKKAVDQRKHLKHTHIHALHKLQVTECNAFKHSFLHKVKQISNTFYRAACIKKQKL